MNKIRAIAIHLANLAASSKQPFIALRWLVGNCREQYRATDDELTQAHLAAINLLKNAGVQTPKRKPLSSLSKGDRQKFRKWAQAFAARMRGLSTFTVFVTRKPIFRDNFGDNLIQVAIIAPDKPHVTTYCYLTYEAMKEWSEMSCQGQSMAAYRRISQFKGIDQTIRENLELIKTDLEALYEQE